MYFKLQQTTRALHINRDIASAHYARRYFALLMIVSVIFSAGLLNKAQAQGAPSDYDPSFGINGKVTTDFSGGNDFASAIVIQPDGKIVLAGITGAGLDPHDDFALARYNTDGSLDDGTADDPTPGDSFGIGGRVTTEFIGFKGVKKVLRQSDGKLVVAAYVYDAETTNARFVLLRYNTDGSLDDGTINDTTPADSFGVGGRVISDFSTSDVTKDFVLQPDGKFLVLDTVNYNFALLRYNSAGNPDTSFGTGGKVISNPFGSGVGGNALLLQPDGKIVVGGTVSDSVIPPYDGDEFALARYNSDGSLDDGAAGDATPGDSFGDGGKVFTTVGSYADSINDMALQSNGKIVAAGRTEGASSFNIYAALARYNTDGSLDDGTANDSTPGDSFGVDGIFYGFGTHYGFSNVVIQPNGKIVVVVTSIGPFGYIAWRLNKDGHDDPGFSTVIPFVGSAIGDIALQPDGKIVVAGSILNASTNNNDFALARFNGDPVSPAINSLTIRSTTVPGSSNLAGTITLNFPAPPAGLVISLNSTNEAASVPAKIRIPAGETTGNFTIKTTPALNIQSGNLIARIGKSVKNVALVVQPLGVASLSLNPHEVEGSKPVTGVVTLNGPAPAGGMLVTLTSRNPGIASPVRSSITIPAGLRTKSFTVRVADVTATRTAVITVTANGISKSAVLTVQ